MLNILLKISRRISSSFMALPNWRQIERMRHVLVHGYYTIDPESLWDTIEVDIPELKPWIVKYLSE